MYLQFVMILITGNTFPVKDELKALGGKWSKRQRGWLVPSTVAEQAQALVDSAPVSERPSKSITYRFNTGRTMMQNRNGRCEDAPCCGCCS